jgi:hypothetical protein
MKLIHTKAIKIRIIFLVVINILLRDTNAGDAKVTDTTFSGVCRKEINSVRRVPPILL